MAAKAAGKARARDARRTGGASRGRIVLAMLVFVAVYGVIGGRLVALGLTPEPTEVVRQSAADAVQAARPDIVDRNGEILATDLTTASLYAEPRRIIDPDEAVEALATVLPELGTAKVRRQLASDAGFIWLRREITARERQAIHDLGIPGIGFLTENRRFYPGGATAGHVVGHVNVDNQGIAGLEKHIDGNGLAALQAVGLARTGKEMEPVRLSVDLRVQHAVRDELARAMERYRAKAAVGIVLDADTAEVMAMVSLPDYDPNDPAGSLDEDRMNRATAGVFELGSVMKAFTTAMALDSGRVTLASRFDASAPIRIGGFTIDDYRGKRRVLSMPEVFIYSSNIGTAKMALHAGMDRQWAFLERLGMMERLSSELPEMARPIKPSRWTELTATTVSFGHGMSVTPMHAAVGAAAILNGGWLMEPTFFPRTLAEARAEAVRVVSPETSAAMRELFWLNGKKGSGRSAQVPGYRVGGKTGTAEKVVNGRYDGDKRLNSFLAAFPMDDPRYVVLVVLDEPQREPGKPFATAGWNAAPTTANVIARIGPMLRVPPRFDAPETPLLVSYGN